MSKVQSASEPISTELFQTNLFDKYDRLYSGYIDATDGFRPSVTLAPSSGQNMQTLTVVAQRVRFNLQSASSGNLNGIFEYDPSKQEVENDFSESVIDSAGASLQPEDQAIVTSLTDDGKRMFVGGNFSANGLNNIFAINDTSAQPLRGDGLDSQVMTMYQNGSTLYVGGNFTKTSNGETRGLNGVAAYSTSDNTWSALGAGVNGVVMSIVPFALNISANKPESVLGVTGFFDRVNGFQNTEESDAENFAVWVPSRNNWLQNINVSAMSISGSLTAFTDIPNQAPLLAGSINSQALGASGAVALDSGNPLSLSSLPMKIRAQQQQGSLSKRALTGERNDTITGIVTATFYHENGLNKTILAGHFAASDSDGQNVTNLLVIDGKDNNRIRGLGDSTLR